MDNTILSPFPVVLGDHVVAPETSRKMEIESKVGAQDEGEVEGPNGSSCNGVANAAKKRKAEQMA